MQALILGCRPFAFVDEKTGEKREGASLWYVPIAENNQGESLIPVKQSVSVEFLNSIKDFKYPCRADLSIEYLSGSQNKLLPKVVGAKFLAPVKLV